jgi:thiamine biosynthesis protein ThiI
MRGGDNMDRVLLIKYGELSTKKGNRNFFIKTLYDNLLDKLQGYDVKIRKDRAHMYIEFKDEEFDSIKNVVDKTFGIHAYNIAYVLDNEVELLKSELLSVIKTYNFSTFKVITKRSNKNFPIHSQDFNHVIGGLILKNIDNISVDVHNPELEVNIEIRDDNTYLYLNTFYGSGGYPVGTQPRAMLMLSGGIDSPVAGYLAMKRGIVLDCVYFEAMPHTSIKAREKVESLAKELLKYTTSINLYIVSITKLQEEIYKNIPSNYMITILRRMMYRIAERLAKKNKDLVLINGESIGQVASQTLHSMKVINSVTNMPVIRPVCCLDKLEIMDLSRKINTYDISILPYEDCCTIFVPKHPVINPDIKTAEEYEKLVNYEEMIDEIMKNIEIKKINNTEEFSNIF